MTESVTPGEGPLTEEEAARYEAHEAAMHSLVDPETGETPPLSPRRLVRPALSSEPLVFVVDPALRRAYIEGSWDDVTEPDDAA